MVAEIKKTAKTGNEVSLLISKLIHMLKTSLFHWPCIYPYIEQVATKILARQLVRLRQQITNLQGSRAQVRGVATHTQVSFLSYIFLMKS